MLLLFTLDTRATGSLAVAILWCTLLLLIKVLQNDHS